MVSLREAMFRLSFAELSPKTRIALFWLFVAAFAIRIFFVFYTPRYMDETESTVRAFNDELSHLNYSLYLVKHRRLPIKDKLHDTEDPYRVEWDWTFYDFEFSQPPLFYLLNIPSALTADPLISSRLFCVLLSSLCLLITVHCSSLIFKQKDIASILAIVFFGFHPVFVRIGSAVTPDNLAWLLSVILFHQLLENRTLQKKYFYGIMIGLGILTKVSFLFWLFFIVVREIPPFFKDRSGDLKKAVVISVIALSLSGWWFVRNWIVYDDPTGLVANSGRPGSYLSSGSLYYYRHFVESVIRDSHFPIVEEEAGNLIWIKGFIVFLTVSFFFQFSKWQNEFSNGLVFRDFLIANIITMVLFLYANLQYSLPEIRNILVGFLPAASFIIAILMNNFGKGSVPLSGAVNLIYYWVVLG